MPILDPSQADDIADYLTAVTGAAQGYVYVGVGINPFRNAKDKIRFRAWQEFPFQWPDQADEVLAALLEFSGEHDCYLCPNVMATAERAKGNSAGAMEIHADVDGGLLNLPLVRSLPGACAVASGSPGNGHAYVLLDRPVKHHHHDQLCRGVMALFGTPDAKCSDNDMLRAPGTCNFKPTVDGNRPVPVRWLVRPNGVRVEPEQLARLLGVELTDEPPPKPKGHKTKSAGGGGVVFEVQPFELLLYPSVRRALARVTADRSADTMHIVGACQRSGLSEANARWAVCQREDLAQRLDQRHDDDIARCFGRASNNPKVQA
jgi:hypothetical protein